VENSRSTPFDTLISTYEEELHEFITTCIWNQQICTIIRKCSNNNPAAVLHIDCKKMYPLKSCAKKLHSINLAGKKVVFMLVSSTNETPFSAKKYNLKKNLNLINTACITPKPHPQTIGRPLIYPPVHRILFQHSLNKHETHSYKCTFKKQCYNFQSNFIFAVRECEKKGKGLKLFVWQDIKALHLLTCCKTLCTPTRPLTKGLPCIWLHRPRVESTKLL